MAYTILYVDDDTDDLLIISEAFVKYAPFFKVMHASNGFEALQALKKMDEQKELPCLVIMDINMPVMNGREALERIKSTDRYKEIPVVLFSTTINQTDKELAASMGAEYVIKPMNYQDLEQLVVGFVEKCRIEAQSEVE